MKENLDMRMVRWIRWHCPPDTGLQNSSPDGQPWTSNCNIGKWSNRDRNVVQIHKYLRSFKGGIFNVISRFIGHLRCHIKQFRHFQIQDLAFLVVTSYCLYCVICVNQLHYMIILYSHATVSTCTMSTAEGLEPKTPRWGVNHTTKEPKFSIRLQIHF